MTATDGVYDKYEVYRLDGNGLKGGMCFVLEVGDRRTWPALLVWAYTVEADGNQQLADDIRRRITFERRTEGP